MALTQAQREARKGKLTASAVGLLMDGGDREVLNLYYEITEDERYEPSDLDDVWPVQLGSNTELFVLHWYARSKGYGPLIKRATTETDERGNLMVTSVELYPDNPVNKMGELICHPVHTWAAATLDAWDSVLGMAVECKHCGNYRKLPDILAKYAPQLHWQMFVTGTKKITLRITIGANEPVNHIVEWDDFYWSTLWDRAQKFWHHVINKNPPPRANSSAPPAMAMTPVVYRTVDLKQLALDGEMLPNWAPEIMGHLDLWLETVDAMKTNATAIDKIKELLPSDVGSLIHDGVKITRNKAGAVTIAKEK